MSCCGNKREQIRQRRTLAVAPTTPAAAPSMQPHTAVVFQGSGAYLAAGEHSREVYRFSPEQPEQSVDPRDAAGLLRTGLFQLRGDSPSRA